MNMKKKNVERNNEKEKGYEKREVTIYIYIIGSDCPVLIMIPIWLIPMPTCNDSLKKMIVL